MVDEIKVDDRGKKKFDITKLKAETERILKRIGMTQLIDKKFYRKIIQNLT